MKRDELDIEEMARRVMEAHAKRQKPVQARRIWARLAGFAGVAVIAAATAAHLATPQPRGAASGASAPVIAQQKARPEPKKPVEVWVGDVSKREDRDVTPVNIRF